MKNLSNKYNHIDVEKNKYDFWLENKLFSPKNDVKENFCVILPPPNVTGKLHLGHAWDVSLQDVLVRYNILLGKNVLWVPGTDHAGIATQTKFEKILKETENLTLEDLGREKFLEKIWVWAKSQSDFIHKQWKKMGIALSYDYEKFTLDSDMNQAVNYVFVELYKNNLIYRKKKLVNWDPILQTAISNIEVIHKETKSKMYYFKYFTEDKKDFVIVATTRPETMFGDVCLVANPKDKRYLKYADKKFINPANGELLPLIFDDYIDIEFGTGIMKCTPAHDFNDNEIAKRHNLKIINILNPDGTIISEIEKYGNLDRFECREKLVEYIKSIGMLDHIEDIENKVGYSERTNAIVEPFLSWQWFIDIKPLANKILEMQKNENEKVQFVPEHFNNTLIQWLNNIEDWCISRQLIWGHQIPIWYKKGANEIYCDVKPPKDEENWTRDPDVLDTWFSSGLWPFITLGWPFKNDLLDKYFPTSVLVTGYDIIFFWVSRMMMFSKFFTNKRPFDNVLIHGLIRDSQGRKMSKSLGNGIDPMDVVDQYGCDSLRLFLTTTSTLGEDLNFSEEKIKANWNFINKLWNGARYILSIENSNCFDFNLTNLEINNLDGFNAWIIYKLANLIKEVKKNMDCFNFVVAFKKIYDFVWDDFLNKYLEITKIDVRNNDIQTISVLGFVLKQVLILLHPFCPFVTEEIYSHIPGHLNSIMEEKYPNINEINLSIAQISELIFEIIFEIRKFRQEKNINNKKQIDIYINNDLVANNINLFNKYLNTNNISIVDNISNNCIDIITNNLCIKVNTDNLVDSKEELKKLENQLVMVENEIKRCHELLFNPNFIQKAPEQKVNIEKEKLAKYQLQYSNLKEQISKLK